MRQAAENKKKRTDFFGIRCPKCGDRMDVVMDSRPIPFGIRRRRQCVACGYRQNSKEVLV